MRSKKAIAAGATALVVAGAFAAISIAGSDRTVSDPRVKVLRPVTAVANPDGRAGDSAARTSKSRKKKPTIQFFYARTATVPPEQGGVVQALRCPKGKGEPIAGGAQTSEGIVISYLSRINPSSGKAPARTYYVGVDDNSDDPAQEEAGALVEIQCAKNIVVKHG